MKDIYLIVLLNIIWYIKRIIIIWVEFKGSGRGNINEIWRPKKSSIMDGNNYERWNI